MTVSKDIQEFLQVKMKAQQNVKTGFMQGIIKALVKPRLDNALSATVKEAQDKGKDKSKVSLDLRDLRLLTNEKLISEKLGFERDSYLMLAVKEGNREAFDFMLPKGFDLLYRNGSGYTVLHLIVKQNLLSILKALCAASGKCLMGAYSALDMQTSKGLTPLHLAVENGSEAMVACIIEMLEKRNVIASAGGKTKTLRENLELECGGKETALIKAVRLKHQKIAQFLLQKGANLYAVNKERRNVLHLAVMNKMKAFVEYLIYLDSDRNLLREAKDCKQRTPRELDSQRQFRMTHVWDFCRPTADLADFRTLLGQSDGKDAARPTPGKRNTPLHVAVTNHAVEIARVLVGEYGANPAAKNTAGETPADVVERMYKPGEEKRRMLEILGEKKSEARKESDSRITRKGSGIKNTVMSKRVEELVEKVREKVKEKKIDLVKLFRKIDKDGNGVLSPAEVECMFICLNIGVQSKEVRELICFADLNHDGQIQYSEFAHLIIPPDLEPSPAANAEPLQPVPEDKEFNAKEAPADLAPEETKKPAEAPFEATEPVISKVMDSAEPRQPEDPTPVENQQQQEEAASVLVTPEGERIPQTAEAPAAEEVKAADSQQREENPFGASEPQETEYPSIGPQVAATGTREEEKYEVVAEAEKPEETKEEDDIVPEEKTLHADRKGEELQQKAEAQQKGEEEEVVVVEHGEQ